MQRHAQSVPIYRDGSKSASVVGCVAVFPYSETFVSLPRMVSIFTAKLCGIFLALTPFFPLGFPQCPSGPWEVVHPTCSGLENTALPGRPSLPAQRRFCLVPSHMGLPGNEKADRVTKHASLVPPFIPYIPASSTPLSFDYP